MLIDIALIIIFSYLCGSIPFGLILTKIFSGKDIRKTGSGNIGATNVLRTGNKYLAAGTLFFDTFKGFLPVFIAQKFFTEYPQLCGLVVFLGHVFPCWLKFKGGKGVATFLGILIALSYELTFIFIFTWIIVILLFKYSSVSSIFSTMTVFVVTLVRETFQTATTFETTSNNLTNNTFILFIFLILVIFTHRKNIYNLKNKNESKLKL